MQVKSGIPIPKVHGRGNRKGCGRNIIRLRNMQVGDSLWDIPKAKMKSLRFTAYRSGFKVKVRKNPINGLYILWKIQ